MTGSKLLLSPPVPVRLIAAQIKHYFPYSYKESTKVQAKSLKTPGLGSHFKIDFFAPSSSPTLLDHLQSSVCHPSD